MSLLAAVRELIKQDLRRTYWIAYSGGLDSEVLLSLCHHLQIELGAKFHAIHIHHGLSANADDWAKHCRHSCERYQINYVEERLALTINPGESLEALARNARYAALAKYLQPDDMLLTAHHEDDQAETVLLQLFRGAGVKGLSAMPAIKKFKQAWLARPLLSFSRATLNEYAKLNKLNWVNDESNYNTQLARNFLRNDIFPLLRTRWPTIHKTIARSARHCYTAQQLLDEWSALPLQQILGSQANTISCRKLSALDAKTQALLLRTWILQCGFSLPNAKKLKMLCTQVLSAKIDRTPSVEWANHIIRRYQDDLYIMQKESTFDQKQIYPWDLQAVLDIGSLGKLQIKSRVGYGLREDTKAITVRFRQGGEKVHIVKRGHRTLKKLFQEWQIPPWLRDRIPLIYSDDKLIAVVGYFIDAEFIAKENEKGVEIIFVSGTD